MLGPILLSLAGFACAFGFLLLRLADPPASITFGLFGGAILLAWGGWLRRRSRGRLALALVCTLGTAAYAFWFVRLSSYEAVDAGPVVGREAPDFEALRATDSARFQLAETRGRNVVLVFYRGPL
ncbi:MAG: hypothetical protein ACT4PV_06095 [Planctomycetaceae bacterium]